MRIFLIGFMGSGKTYVGKKLAEYADLTFVDLDEWIEQQAQRSIPDIFSKNGENFFRRLEQHALHQMDQSDNMLVSTGGGTPCFFDNMQWMNQNGITIYLDTPIEILVQRLLPQQAKRPLIKDLNKTELSDFIKRKLTERTPFYEQAQVIYRTRSADEEVAANLLLELKNIIGH